MSDTIVEPKLSASRSRRVDATELALIPAPVQSGRYYPIPHSEVREITRTQLERAGYSIRNEQLAVSHDGHKFFGVFGLENTLANGAFLAVGIRGSTDKSLTHSFCAGTRVVVCDNLSFGGEIRFNRRHTRNGLTSFTDDILGGIGRLSDYARFESTRIEALKGRTINDAVAESVILRSLESGIINTREVLPVLEQWRKPVHEDFAERNAWSLFNGFTEILKPRFVSQPGQAQASTVALSALLFGDEKSITLAI